MRYRLSLWLLLLLPSLPLCGQKALTILHDGQPYLVCNSWGGRYEFYVDGKLEHEPVGKGVTAFRPVGMWYPGSILIEDLKATVISTFHVSGGATDFEIEYSFRATADRDLDGVYCLMYCERPDGKAMNVVCDVGHLRKGITKKLRYNLSVRREFSDFRFTPHFLCQGYELITTEVRVADTSPYTRWLQTDTKDKDAPDSPPMAMRAVRPMPDVGKGKEAHGQVKFKLEVDAQGYVQKAEPVEPKDGPLVQAVREVIYLWEFKPRIEHGKPVKCSFVVPFNF